MGEMERIAAAIRGGNTRSPLYRWMRRNHDRLTEAMEGERPDWKVLTAEFAAMGLVAADARPETVRHVWWRARQAVAKARAKRGPVAPAARHDHFGEANKIVGDDPLAELRRQLDERSGRR